jgi:hypothetical protein
MTRPKTGVEPEAWSVISLRARATKAEARVAFLEKHCEVVETRVAELESDLADELKHKKRLEDALHVIEDRARDEAPRVPMASVCTTKDQESPTGEIVSGPASGEASPSGGDSREQKPGVGSTGGRKEVSRASSEALTDTSSSNPLADRDPASAPFGGCPSEARHCGPACQCPECTDGAFDGPRPNDACSQCDQVKGHEGSCFYTKEDLDEAMVEADKIRAELGLKDDACSDKAVSGRTTSAQSNISNWRGPLPQGQSEDYVRGYNDALNVNRTETPVPMTAEELDALPEPECDTGDPSMVMSHEDIRRVVEANAKVLEAARAWDKSICWESTGRMKPINEEWDLHDAIVARALVTGSTPSTCRHCHASVPNGFNCCTRCADERAP